MSIEVKMPQLSDTMDAGKIIAWNKKEGDKIARGDILAEVETDKANLEIESFHEGYLLKIVTPAGSSAIVGHAIAIIGAQGEAIATSTSAATTTLAGDTPLPSSNPPTEPKVAQMPIVESAEYGRIKASPLAKKLATQHNLNLSVIQGSGPNGRIIRKDVENHTSMARVDLVTNRQTNSAAQQAHFSSSTNVTQQPNEFGGTLEPLSKMRATIAKRMQQAVTECPHFYTSMAIDMTAATQLRSAFKQDSDFKDISINHLIIKAAAYALQKENGVNCSVKDEQLFVPNQINIGVVTAVTGGLLIPVIKNTNYLNLKDLAFETRAAIERARAGRPSASDLSGGTFSISNMGMYSVKNFTAIINPGQGAILAVGATIDQVVAKNGVMQIAPVMEVTLSVDHRIIDGTMAGNWLSCFKQALEIPALLMN